MHLISLQPDGEKLIYFFYFKHQGLKIYGSEKFMGFCQGLAHFELKNTFAWVKFFADKVLCTITWSVHQYQTEPKQSLMWSP